MLLHTCNFTDIIRDGLTAHELRHGFTFGCKLVPFGAEVDYKLSSFKETQDQLKFQEWTRKGIFLGYHMQSIWHGSGDYIAFDKQAFANAVDFRGVKSHFIKDIAQPVSIRFPVKELPSNQNA